MAQNVTDTHQYRVMQNTEIKRYQAMIFGFIFIS